MTCDPWREAISAMVDGEDPGIDARLVDAHLAACAGCREFAVVARSGRAPMAAAPDPADVAPVVRAAVRADRAAHPPWIRVLLAVVGTAIVVLSLRALVLGAEHDTAAHAARHLGAFTTAYGVGLLVVVARPARARTMLPVAGVLAVALVITAVIDTVEGRTPITGELRHGLEIVSVALVWLLAVPTGDRWPTARRIPHGVRPHLVDGADDR